MEPPTCSAQVQLGLAHDGEIWNLLSLLDLGLLVLGDGHIHGLVSSHIHELHRGLAYGQNLTCAPLDVWHIDLGGDRKDDGPLLGIKDPYRIHSGLGAAVLARLGMGYALDDTGLIVDDYVSSFLQLSDLNLLLHLITPQPESNSPI